MDQNSVQESQVPTQVQGLTAHALIEPNNPWKYIVLGVVAIIIVSVGAFLLGRRSAINSGIVVSTNPAPTSITGPSTAPSQPSPDKSDWLTYEFNGFQSTWEGWIWKPFVIYYPPTWSISENIKDETNLSFKLTLKKDDGSRLSITQGFGEGGRCLFQDDSDAKTFNGMGMPVATYIEIQRQDDIWRLSTVNSTDVPKSYILCGKNPKTSSQYGYGMNDVGISDVYYATDESGQELVEMLKRIEVK